MNTPTIHILSVRTALPGPLVDNAALARRLGVGDAWAQWAETGVGVRSRHLARDLESGEITHTLADLGESAAREALAAAGLDAQDVDLLVMGTTMPDMLMPATVNIVADRLGVNDVPTYQLQAGCSALVQAFQIAVRRLAGGAARTALVLGGDTWVKHVDPSGDVKRLSPAELVTLALAGDGAGCAVLSVEPRSGAPVLRSVRSQLAGGPPAQTVEWFGAHAGTGRPAVTEDRAAVEERVPVLAAEAWRELLEDAGWKDSDVDVLLPPQCSGRITARVSELLGLPGLRATSCVEEIGNNGNGLLLFQLEQALAGLTGGGRAVGLTVEATEWARGGIAVEVP